MNESLLVPGVCVSNNHADAVDRLLILFMLRCHVAYLSVRIKKFTFQLFCGICDHLLSSVDKCIEGKLNITSVHLARKER